MGAFEIGDLVYFVDKTEANSKLHIVVDIGGGKLTAERRENGHLHSINAAFKHFVKHRSIRDFYKI